MTIQGSDLQGSGWARYRESDIVGASGGESGAHFEQIRRFFETLPPDRYAPDSHRYRRHARAVYLPWASRLSWLPNIDDPEYGAVVDYDMQGYNEEFTDVRRQYPAIPTDIQRNPLLERMIRFDLEQTMWLDGFRQSPLNVGVGCVKLGVDDSSGEAAATPNTIHQDGGARSFTFIHLVTRENVHGAVNYIAPPRCVGLLPSEISADLIHSEFILEQPLDGFAVHNSRVSHYVSPVRKGDQSGAGARGVVLVAISPLVKQL
ncbi:2OG-Fe dioxygenase family protein [Amycolatopsis pithecellobii]|nr:2OG-Fe dioxygenase family protein [Amycolatopsis pithecellobii]